MSTAPPPDDVNGSYEQLLYRRRVATYETAIVDALLRKAERSEYRTGGTAAAWVIDVLRAELARR